MIELRDMVLRLRRGEGVKSLHRATGRHKTVVRKLRALAQEHGWLEATTPPTEADIQGVWQGHPEDEPAPGGHALDGLRTEIEGWLEAKYSFVAIHRLVAQRIPCSEPTVRRYIQKVFRGAPKAVVPRTAQPGEVMEVDFGLLGLMYDGVEKRDRKAWVFSARLRFSRRAYRRIVFTQDQETFFDCHVAAFERFGGVPAQVVPDNLKAAVIKASHEDPLVNRAYRSLAEHYGFAINPCLPRTPRHKGGVESDMKYVQSSFWPLFREEEKALGHEVPRFERAQVALDSWNTTIAETRTVGKTGATVVELFAEEARALNPLNGERWAPMTCAQCKVGLDWRIQFRRAFYTVPYRLIGETVLACGTRTAVRIFHGGVEVAVHSPASRPWAVEAVADHGPPNAKAYLATSSRGLLLAAQRIGPSTGLVAQAILDDRAVDAIRPLRALIKLQDRYPVADIEEVSVLLLATGTATFRSLKNELRARSERVHRETFRFARPAGYYQEAANG
jgi:transposase